MLESRISKAQLAEAQDSKIEVVVLAAAAAAAVVAVASAIVIAAMAPIAPPPPPAAAADLAQHCKRGGGLEVKAVPPLNGQGRKRIAAAVAAVAAGPIHI